MGVARPADLQVRRSAISPSLAAIVAAFDRLDRSAHDGCVVPPAHLLERDDPLARLQAAVADAASGAGRLVLVTGEAGVGKTSLVESVEPAGLRVWLGSCERLFAARPLGPLVDVAVKTGGALWDAVSRRAPAHEVFSVLLAALRSSPTMLVIEDVHWADEATLDVVALLARRMPTTCSLAIVTSREELAPDHPVRMVLGELASAGIERLRLSPLSLQAVRELAAPHQVDADGLFRRTAGNPFYVTEVLATGGTYLPSSVRDAVLARAAGLDPGRAPCWRRCRSCPGRSRSSCSWPWEACTRTGSMRASRQGCWWNRPTGSRSGTSWPAPRSSMGSNPCDASRSTASRCGCSSREGAMPRGWPTTPRPRTMSRPWSSTRRSPRPRPPLVAHIGRRRRSTGGRCGARPSGRPADGRSCWSTARTSATCSTASTRRSDGSRWPSSCGAARGHPRRG